ncbi:MAG: hypothetical protein ABR559_02400 [Gemmatimonadota bacterium]
MRRRSRHTPRSAARPGGACGTALPVVLWALIALAALALWAAVAASVDLALAGNHRDHAAALALAEAGLADVLAAVAEVPARGLRPDSLAGRLETGSYRARWAPAPGGIRVTATGASGPAGRSLEAWIAVEAGGALQITAWREVL